MKLAVIFSFLLVFVALFFASANQDAKAPIPKERPYEVWIKSVNDKDLFEKLKNINDKNAQKRIIEALKGNCSNQNNLKKSGVGKALVNVNHNQCKPAGPKSKGGKDGQKCNVQGVQGGSIEAMCLNGCCVQISSSKNDSTFSGQTAVPGSSSGSGLGNSLMNSPASQGMFQSIFDNLFKMFSGSDAGSDYQPYDYYQYDANNSIINDQVPDSVIDGFNSVSNNFETIKSDADKTDTITHEQNTNNEAQTQSNLNTKNNTDVETEFYKLEDTNVNEVKEDMLTNTKPIYRAFSTNTDNNIAEPENNEPVIVEEQSISVAYNNINNKANKVQNIAYKDSSATGFNNSEKVAVQELSFWQKIILAIKSAFGL